MPLLLAILLLSSNFLYAQIAINEDGSNADPSAMLDVQSSDKGMLVPRMSSNQRTNITNPATGLLVFDTTTGSFWFHDGTWQELGSNGGNGGDALWEMDNGNIINTDLTTASVGIGTDNVLAKLHVLGEVDQRIALQVDGNPDFYEVGFVGPTAIRGNSFSAPQGGFEGGVGGDFRGGLMGMQGIGTSLYGVRGESTDAAGVHGSSTNSYGVSGTASNETAGVYGYGDNASVGVKGESPSTGVFGSSTGYIGVLGTADGGNGIGVYGRSPSGVGVFGYTANPASHAGYFVGNVMANGYFIPEPNNPSARQGESTLANGMQIIAQLRPKSYRYSNGQFRGVDLPKGTHYGLMAQDLETVLPQLVQENSTVLYDWEKFDRDTEMARALEEPTPNEPDVLQTITYQAINYTELIPIVIAGIQEQQTNLQGLEQQNAALQTEVNTLKQANEELKATLQSLARSVQQLQQQNSQ